MAFPIDCDSYDPNPLPHPNPRRILAGGLLVGFLARPLLASFLSLLFVSACRTPSPYRASSSARHH